MIYDRARVYDTLMGVYVVRDVPCPKDVIDTRFVSCELLQSDGTWKQVREGFLFGEVEPTIPRAKPQPRQRTVVDAAIDYHAAE